MGWEVGEEGGGQAKLLDVDTGRLSGLKYELIQHLKLVVDMVRGDIREFVNDAWDLVWMTVLVDQFGLSSM